MRVVDDIWRDNDGDGGDWWAADVVTVYRPRLLLRWCKSHMHIRQFERPTLTGRSVVFCIDGGRQRRLWRRQLWGCCNANAWRHLLVAVHVVEGRLSPWSEWTWLQLVSTAHGREVSGVIIGIEVIADGKRTVTDDWIVAVVTSQHLQQSLHLQLSPQTYVQSNQIRFIKAHSTRACNITVNDDNMLDIFKQTTVVNEFLNSLL